MLEAVRKYILIIIIALILIIPGKALADGMIIPPPIGSIKETDQKAVIWHDGETETIILSIVFKGDVKEFAWVIPVPAKPDVTKGVDELFVSLDDLTSPKRGSDINIAAPGLFGGVDRGAKSVTVIETKKVDIYDISVLSAQDSSDLQSWLEENGYEYPKNKEHLLRSYINRGWYFVAAKVNTQELPLAAGLKTGHATPLKISFPSEKIVYPLKISGKAADSEFVDEGEEKIAAYSFETGIQNWSGGTVTSESFWDGNKSLKVVVSPTLRNVTVANSHAFTNISGLSIGKTYVFSAYVKSVNVLEGWAKFRLTGLTFEDQSSGSVDLSTISDWERLYVNFKAQRSSYQFTLRADQASIGSEVFWDGIQLEEGSYPGKFDGELMPSVGSKPIVQDERVDILMYVFADNKKEAPGWNVEYAGQLNEKKIEDLAFDDDGNPWVEAEKKMYLTRLTRSMQQSEMTSDVYLRDAENNYPVGGGSNTGWNNLLGGVGLRIFLVFGVPLLLEIGVVLYIWKRRYRK